MTVQNLWPLAFLVLVPAIIFLYILKQKTKEEDVPSLFLWNEVYKNLRADTPFEKLKHNILMYLQILLMLLLIFALMAPVAKKGGAVRENIVLVVDKSASMSHLYKGEETRLEYSVKQAKEVVDGLSEGANVTLVTCGSEAAVVYQGTDKVQVKRRLNDIEHTLETGNLSSAIPMVNSLISGMEQADVYCYTDTEFADKDMIKGQKKVSLYVENAYSAGENMAVEYLSYGADNGVEAIARVCNYGTHEKTEDISLYAGDELIEVTPVTVKPNESETVYFEKADLALDGKTLLTAELSDRDALTEDNRQSVVLKQEQEKKVLLISEGNVFLEKALGLDEFVTVYKSSDAGVLKEAEDEYDLYVFDGLDKLSKEAKKQGVEEFSLFGKEGLLISGEYKLPENSAVMVLNDNSSYRDSKLFTPTETVENAYLSFNDKSGFKYLDGVQVGVTKAQTYELPDWAEPFLCTEDGKAVGYYGTLENRNAAVLGMDLHNSDFALKTEYPILLSQLTKQLLGQQDEGVTYENFPVAEESNVTPVSETKIEGKAVKKKTGSRTLRNHVLALCILLLVLEWIIYSRQVHTRKKKQFLAVRFLVLITIVLAMAGITISTRQKKCETIFLVDVSDSMSGNIKQMREYLHEQLRDVPKKNTYGIVAFGKDALVEQFLTDEGAFSDFTVTPVSTATNIENALNTACSMFDDGVTKRLVLLSDGSENEGGMNIAANTIKAGDVEFMALPFPDTISKSSEVYVDGLDAPDVIHEGDHYNVTVSVTSNVETDAVLTLYSGRTAKGRQQIHVTKGKNRYVFEDYGESGTIAGYKAVIEPDLDTVSVNNTYVTFAEIEAKARVLLVEGTPNEGKEFEKVLDAANMEYDTVNPASVPVSLSQLNNYKAVITLNVFYDDLRKGFAKSLKSYVKDYSGGYICIGGDSSYALGDYRGTELEELLPVNVDIKGEQEVPKMAMAMVIDQSGSMSSPSVDDANVTGLALAKQAALSAVDEIRSTDEVGVLAFDDRFNWTVPLQENSNPADVEEKIATIGYGGGTSIYPALKEACDEISKSDAKLKHIILLTDGQDSFNGYSSLYGYAKKEGITISTVAVGSESDKRLLKNIALNCEGRYYYTDVNNSIPRIFAQEVYLATNAYIINEKFYPAITSGSRLLNGVADEGLPALYGYVATSPKSTADVVLSSGRDEPVLSTWQCGLGRTVAWCSDGDNAWTSEYASWQKYPLLWSNIIYSVIADTKLGDDELDIVKEGNSAVISYSTKDYTKDTGVTAVVTNENGEKKEVALDVTKPGSYEASLDLSETGILNISLRKSDGDKLVKNYNTAFANQYSKEYQFNDNENMINAFTSQVGGQLITLKDSVFTDIQAKTKSRFSLTTPLLIMAALLFMLDVAARRFSLDLWNGIKGLFGRIFRRRVKESVSWTIKDVSRSTHSGGKHKTKIEEKGKKEHTEESVFTAEYDISGQSNKKSFEQIKVNKEEQTPVNSANAQDMAKPERKKDSIKTDKSKDSDTVSATNTMEQLLQKQRERK